MKFGIFLQKFVINKFIFLVLVIMMTYKISAMAELTYSAFTKEGKALNNELSVLNEKEKFKIIFLSDKKSNYDLIIKADNKVIYKKPVQITDKNKLTLPDDLTLSDNPDSKWYNLRKVKKNLTIKLKNSEKNLRLIFRKYEIRNNLKSFNEKIDYIGEPEKVDFLPYPDFKEIHLEDKSLTSKDLVFRGSAVNNIPKKYKSSVVLIKTSDQIGAGFMIGNDKILTNWHVVKNQKKIGITFKAKLYDRISLKNASIAEVVLTDKEKDLALLKLGSKMSILPFSFSESQDIDYGFKVSTFGHPFGLMWSFNTGVVSAKRPNWPWNYENSKHKAKLVYQTQLPIDKGNSGGPLLDENGKIIGIVTSFHSQNKNINFAVSSDDIKEFLAGETVKRTEILSVKVPSKPFDINKDGIADGMHLDTDKDGIYDTKVFQKDSGITEFRTDRNRNGIIEVKAEIIPNYGGGKDRHIYWDYNEDGDWNYVWIDLGNNGKINHKIKI